MTINPVINQTNPYKPFSGFLNDVYQFSAKLYYFIAINSPSILCKPSDKKHLEAFEIWIWERMLKISRKDKVANASVLEQVKKERRMLNTI